MSSLKDQLKADLTKAMKLRNEVETSTLRMTLAAIMNAEVAGDQAIELTDDQENCQRIHRCALIPAQTTRCVVDDF